jgi:hypothetical protein
MTLAWRGSQSSARTLRLQPSCKQQSPIQLHLLQSSLRESLTASSRASAPSSPTLTVHADRNLVTSALSHVTSATQTSSRHRPQILSVTVARCEPPSRRKTITIFLPQTLDSQTRSHVVGPASTIASDLLSLQRRLRPSLYCSGSSAILQPQLRASVRTSTRTPHTCLECLLTAAPTSSAKRPSWVIDLSASMAVLLRSSPPTKRTAGAGATITPCTTLVFRAGLCRRQQVNLSSPLSYHD